MSVIPHKLQAELTTKAREGNWRIAPLGTLAIALAIGAHMVTSQRAHTLWGALLFLVAVILFMFLPFGAGGHETVLPADETRERRAVSMPLVSSTVWRWAFLITGVLLMGVAYDAFGGNRLDRGFWLWLTGLVYCLVALAERPAPGWQRWIKAGVAKADWRWTALVLAITAVAAFFRLHNLDATPAEMTSDHAEKLLDVFDVLNGHRAIFFPRNTGREAFQFYLTAALIHWTPLELGHLALKVGTALFGIVTVPMTYLLGRELFDRCVGAIAAFLLAISYWHVTVSRVGLRFPFTAAFAIPALYFLLRALRRNRRNDWLAAGAFLGAGLHTYTAMRIVPLLFILLVTGKFLADIVRGFIARWKTSVAPFPPVNVSLAERYWLNALAGGALALGVFLPLLRYMVEFPESFWYRAATRVQDASMSLYDIWRLFWFNTWNALLMFNVRGDTVPMNTVPESPALGPLTGGLFILGLSWVVWRLFRHRKGNAGFLALSFFTLLLPSIISFAFPGENPSVVRAGGAVPIVMIVAAIPVALVLNGMKHAPRSVSLVVALFITLLVVGALAYNYDWYFRQYDANVNRSLWNATEMGRVLKTFEEDGGMLRNAYHVAYPHWVDTRNIAINAGDIRWQNVVSDLSQIAGHAQRPGRKLYLVFPSHTAALKILADIYPEGEARLQHSEHPGKSFYVFEAPAP